MDKIQEFDFGNDGVAAAYDAGLVPVLFKPWAERLVAENGPWKGQNVLDLAAGTGIVSEVLCAEIGPSGKIFVADLNPEMLALAESRCSGLDVELEFMCCPAESLKIDDSVIDIAVCQQGFQFFADKINAASELFRVLRDGGRVVLSTWLSVDHCQYFGLICRVLERISEPELSATMRIPFDFMPASELVEAFETAGFKKLCLEQQRMGMELEGGAASGLKLAWATPAGPGLNALPESKLRDFEELLSGMLEDMSKGGKSMGMMWSNVFVAEKLG